MGGPRPERPEIAEQYYRTMPDFQLRLQVKAGLTGYAQVYGTGHELQWFSERGGLSLELLLSPFDSDFTTYTTFYGMVQSYPNT